jgi:hypothetical protein
MQQTVDSMLNIKKTAFTDFSILASKKGGQEEKGNPNLAYF